MTFHDWLIFMRYLYLKRNREEEEPRGREGRWGVWNGEERRRNFRWYVKTKNK